MIQAMPKIEHLRKMNDLLDVVYQMGFAINDRRDYFDGKTTEEVAEWISEKLINCGFPVTPCGACWGTLSRSYIEE